MVITMDLIKPVNKFQIIYLDPPWSYKDKALAGNRGAECKYPVMSLEEIKKLPIQQIADENCALFIWITMPLLYQVFDVISAYGFKYKTCAFNWIKRNKKSNTYFWGMGNYSRGNGELCLLATKGNPKRISASVHSIIDTPIEGHSKKPDIVRDKIVELFGDIPRIELFARNMNKYDNGWVNVGNDIDGTDIRDSLQQIIHNEYFDQKSDHVQVIL